MKIFTGCLTDRGNYRSKNQDRAVCHVKKGKKTVIAAACVCDGIGSFTYSEIASEMVTNGISRWFTGIAELYPDSMDEETLVEDFDMTIRELNELVCSYRMERGIDIGCTMSSLLLINRHYYVYHAGDSRICMIGDEICQLTRDEVSVIENDGQVRRLLANYIGRTPELWINRVNGEISGKVSFLIGSDGLFKRLLPEDIFASVGIVKKDTLAQKACETLCGLVLSRGERDNVSCILISIG